MRWAGSEVVPKAAHRRPLVSTHKPKGARVSAPLPIGGGPQGLVHTCPGQQCAHQEGSQRVSCQATYQPRGNKKSILGSDPIPSSHHEPLPWLPSQGREAQGPLQVPL